MRLCLLILVLVGLLAGCGDGRNEPAFCALLTAKNATESKVASGSTSSPATLPNVPKPIVFIGDSITDFWQRYTDFPARDWIDAGVDGETTAKMLARFDSDVLAKSPGTVHILGGSNDNWLGIAPTETEANLQAMITKARNANVAVVLGTLPPMRDSFVRKKPWAKTSADQVNSWIMSQENLRVVDYHHAMMNSRCLLADHIHPNASGYSVMTSSAEAVMSPQPN